VIAACSFLACALLPAEPARLCHLLVKNVFEISLAIQKWEKPKVVILCWVSRTKLKISTRRSSVKFGGTGAWQSYSGTKASPRFRASNGSKGVNGSRSPTDITILAPRVILGAQLATPENAKFCEGETVTCWRTSW